ncbi:MAG: nucleotidyl transferase AbiEii/AbiGii toxin family protein [Candidatus Omnitrophica bacterium]|nr:nucleotidyl transferase AbiEii/AbiGii toxin family protein [Candidatus Omnitrophota bacterium]
MFTEALSKNTQKALAILGKSHFKNRAYLGGGTALCLQMGHRISVDLDFFTSEEFDFKELVRDLKKLGSFALDRGGWGTVWGEFEKVKFSMFTYKYPVLFPFKSLWGIKILDLRDISAMKIDAISTRGLKRDFIDLYFICKRGISLKKILLLYNRKYGTLASNFMHIQKSLVYFVDAEMSVMPKMLKKIKWEEVKKFFEEEVKSLAKNDFAWKGRLP